MTEELEQEQKEPNVKSILDMTTEEVVMHIEELRRLRLHAAEERILEKARKQAEKEATKKQGTLSMDKLDDMWGDDDE